MEMDLVLGSAKLLEHSFGLVHLEAVAEENSERERGGHSIRSMVMDAPVQQVVAFQLLLESINVLPLGEETSIEDRSNVPFDGGNRIEGLIIGEALERTKFVARDWVGRDVEFAHVACKARRAESKLAGLLDCVVRKVQAMYHVVT